MSATPVLEAIQDAIARLRENGQEADNSRWLPGENLDLLDKAGVFSAAVPRRFGGLELSLPEKCAAIAEIARGCSASGWTGVVYLSNTWAVTLFPERVQEEVFAGGSVRVSGVYAPTGTLTPVEGGYIVSGSWKFNSGCRGAHWNIVTCLVSSDVEVPDVRVAILPMSELTVVDDWDTSAAAGTGSCTTTARDVFVPEHRVIAFSDALSMADTVYPEPTGRQYGLITLSIVESTAACVGMAKAALELFLGRLPGRGITYTSWTEQSETPVTQIQVAKAEAQVAAAEALLETWTTRLQARADAGRLPSADERTAVRGQCAYAIQLAREAVAGLYDASGASVIQRAVPIQRFHRDLHAYSLHGLLLLNTNLEARGRVLVGKDPGTPIL